MWVPCGIHLGIGLQDVSIFPNDISDPLGVPIARRVARPVGQPNFSVRVAQQRKRELELLREGGILFDRVEADAEDLNILGVIVLDSITESFAFVGSTGRIGLGIKPQDDFSPGEVTQGHFLSLVSSDSKFDSLFSTG